MTTHYIAGNWLAGQGGITALGIGSFGPVELDRTSPRWGFITTTPKPGWADCDIAGYFGGALGVPVGFDTDVNAAALAEHAASGSAGGSLAYLTVCTGIGGGLVLDGQPAQPGDSPSSAPARSGRQWPRGWRNRPRAAGRGAADEGRGG